MHKDLHSNFDSYVCNKSLKKNTQKTDFKTNCFIFIHFNFNYLSLYNKLPKSNSVYLSRFHLKALQQLKFFSVNNEREISKSYALETYLK